jgi:hypothetical protein
VVTSYFSEDMMLGGERGEREREREIALFAEAKQKGEVGKRLRK